MLKSIDRACIVPILSLFLFQDHPSNWGILEIYNYYDKNSLIVTVCTQSAIGDWRAPGERGQPSDKLFSVQVENFDGVSMTGDQQWRIRG